MIRLDRADRKNGRGLFLEDIGHNVFELSYFIAPDEEAGRIVTLYINMGGARDFFPEAVASFDRSEQIAETHPRDALVLFIRPMVSFQAFVSF